MNELHTAAGTATEATGGDPGTCLPLGVDPNAPPLVRDAATAYFTELDELLEHLAAHPSERWVAYYGSRRIGFGTDDLVLHRECRKQFPDGLYRVYMIDGANKYLEDTVV